MQVNIHFLMYIIVNNDLDLNLVDSCHVLHCRSRANGSMVAKFCKTWKINYLKFARIWLVNFESST